jgi:ABC-type antimicrobial peptide transport system permease subunit
MIAVQGMALGCLGIAAGTGMYWAAARALARTPVPMEASGEIFVGVVAVYLLVCMLASFSAAMAIFRLEPQAVFATHA